MNVCAKGCYRLSAGMRVSLLNGAKSPGDTAFCLQNVSHWKGLKCLSLIHLYSFFSFCQVVVLIWFSALLNNLNTNQCLK